MMKKKSVVGFEVQQDFSILPSTDAYNFYIPESFFIQARVRNVDSNSFEPLGSTTLKTFNVPQTALLTNSLATTQEALSDFLFNIGVPLYLQPEILEQLSAFARKIITTGPQPYFEFVLPLLLKITLVVETPPVATVAEMVVAAEGGRKRKIDQVLVR